MCEYSCDTPFGKKCNATASICPSEHDDCGTRIESLLNDWILGVRDVTDQTAQFVRNYLRNYDISVGELNDMPIEKR